MSGKRNGLSFLQLKGFLWPEEKYCGRNLQEIVSCPFIVMSLSAKINPQAGNKIYHSKITTLHSSWFCEAYL